MPLIYASSNPLQQLWLVRTVAFGPDDVLIDGQLDDVTWQSQYD